MDDGKTRAHAPAKPKKAQNAAPAREGFRDGPFGALAFQDAAGNTGVLRLLRDGDRARTIARQGIGHDSQPLPHADRIQTSFGRHDVRGIRTRIGGPARDANEQLGSDAYAVDGRIGFRSAPDLRLAAHEAAHVVHQRAGVSLQGGVSTRGDAHEQHADRVAHAVVAGASAEPLLDAIPGATPRTWRTTTPVQMDARPKDFSGKPLPLTAPVYARTYLNLIRDAIAAHLTSAKLPRLHPRLSWTNEATAIAALTGEFYTYVSTDPGAGSTRLYELMHPVDLWKLIDETRGAPPGDPRHPRLAYNDIHSGPTTPEAWDQQVGIAIAGALYPYLVRSIARMGMRLCVQLDNPVRVEYSDLDKASLADAAKGELLNLDLVVSHPLDRVIVEVLATSGMVTRERQDKKARPPDDTPGKPFLNGLRIVEYEWLGPRDPALWNWIRVTSPPHPTAEDVAYTLYTRFEQKEVARSDQAYLIQAKPPYFRIPYATAVQIKEANKYRPPDQTDPFKVKPVVAPNLVLAFAQQSVDAMLATLDGKPLPDTLALARSAIADEVALTQSAPAAKPGPDSERAVDHAHMQLEYLRQRLRPWKLAAWLSAAGAFVDRRLAEANDPRAKARWLAVVVAQESTLRQIASELGQVLDNLEAQGVKPSDAGELGPTLGIIEAYATAAALSHLPGDARAALASARQLKGLLPLALAEDKIKVARLAIADQSGAQVRTGLVEEGAGETMRGLPTLLTRAAELRAKVARGETIDPDVVAQLDADADEIALRARLLTLVTEAHNLQKQIEDVGLTTDKTEGGYTTAWGQTDILKRNVKGWLANLDDGKKRAREFVTPAAPVVVLTEDEKRRRRQEVSFLRHTGAHTLPGHQPAPPPTPAYKPTDARKRVEMLQQTVVGVQSSIASFNEQFDIKGLFEWANDQIASKKLSDAIWSIVLNLGLAVLTGQIAGLIVAGVRGFALARQAVALGEAVAQVRQASLLYSTFDVVVHAGVATLTQRASGQKGGLREFAENVLAIKLTNAALHPFRKFLKDAEGVSTEVYTWAQATRRGSKLAARAVVELGAGAAGSTAAHAITHFDQVHILGGEEWILQGLALVANKFVHQRMQKTYERVDKTARTAGEFSGLKELRAKLAELDARALNAQKRPSHDESRRQLAERYKLLLEEQRLYARLALDGKPVPAAKALAEEFAMLGGEFAEVPLRFASLKPVVEGAIYEGTTDQIRSAFQAASEMGLPTKTSFDETTGRWRLETGGRIIEVQDIAWRPAPKGKAAAGTAAPAKPGEPGNPYEFQPGETAKDVRKRLFDQQPGETLEAYRDRLKAMEGDVETGALKSGHTKIFDEAYSKLLGQLDVDIVQLNGLRSKRVKLQEEFDGIDAEYRRLLDARVKAKTQPSEQYPSAAETSARLRRRLKAAELEAQDEKINSLARRGDARSAEYDYRDVGRMPPCFPPGTTVKTPTGDRAIESLREGDLVLAWDAARRSVDARPVVAVHHNWSDTLVEIELPGGTVHATRAHPFWLEDEQRFAPAGRLAAGALLRGVEGPVAVRTIAERHTPTVTVNLEVGGLHSFYVGADGVMVHNGDAEDYGSLTRTETRIYEVYDVKTGTVFYIGKTVQTLAQRFQGHIDEKLDWAKRYANKEIAIREVTKGNWTKFETAVWETHYIFKALRAGLVLENIDIPVTESTFKKYRRNFRGC